MLEQELRFSGSVPEKYDGLMVPLIFRPYALELARRARDLRPCDILETAAGTGALTEALHEALPSANIIATDLNQPMLDVAAQRLRSDRIRFAQASADELPFEDRSFDLVACQFGAMFFPDKVQAHSEAWRTLKNGGHYLLAIWDRIEVNELSDAAQRALVESFADDPPLFMREGPFGYHDSVRIASDLRNAGFDDVTIETTQLRSCTRSARDAALALFYGTPMGVEVEQREAGSGARVFESIERALRAFEGCNGVDAPMAAHIVTATKA